MCGGCAPATGINSPPEGGVHGPPARFACAVPAAPRALPGWGLAPPDLQGCAPWRAFAHRAPAASVTQPEGFRARVRPVAGVVNRLRLSTLDAQPLPLSPGFSFSKARQPERGQAAGLSTGGRQSRSGGGGQTPAPPAGRLSTLGGQRGCPRPERVQGGAVVQNNLIGQTFLVLHNQPAQSRASIGFQENHCIKK